MDYVFVRTKLQALIAEELIQRGVIRLPFVFVPMYRFDVDEDTQSVKALYAALGRQAKEVHPIVQSDGLLSNAWLIARLLLRCSVARSTAFISVLNSYAFALALKTNPFVRIVTFDDGLANLEVRDECSYLSTQPLPRGGVKKFIARSLFPAGAAAYCRSRIAWHFTIYPGLPNVVPPEKLLAIELDWSQFLTPDDIRSIPVETSRVLLGTAYGDLTATDWRAAYEWAVLRCDVYLPHPRQREHVWPGIRVVETTAPAEAVMCHLLNSNAKHLTLYHFGSSAALSFRNHPRITTIDLTEFPGTDSISNQVLASDTANADAGSRPQ